MPVPRLLLHPAVIRARSWAAVTAVVLACAFALTVATGTASAASVAAGGSQSCAVKPDGKVWCWGTAGAGLGNGTSTLSAVPVAVPGAGTASAVTVGDGFACALGTDRTVRCWGAGSDGQLGDGNGSSSPTPVAVSGLGDAVAIDAGEDHACAVRADGRVACWGDGGNGRLGDGATTDRDDPVHVAGITDAVAVAAGEAHSCAVRASGGVACWGEGDDGRLGDGATIDRLAPVAVGGIGDAVAISAGDSHTCIVRHDGTVACWGRNETGQLGDGTTVDRSVPAVVPDVDGAVHVTAGERFTCVARGGSTSRCWGAGSDGQLGSTVTGASSPGPVDVPGTAGAIEVAASGSHACLRTAAAEVRCWGRGSWGPGTAGQLGNGRTGASADPVAATGITDATVVTAGIHHACGLRTGGTVSCWGRGNGGRLGNGSITGSAVPVPVTGLGDATAIATGSEHSCVIRGGGTALGCWGVNNNRQLGISVADPAAQSSYSTVPTAVHVAGIFAGKPGTPTFRAVSAGSAFSCALVAVVENGISEPDGEVWCWGDGYYGQVGDGGPIVPDRHQVPEPVKVQGGGPFLPVAPQADGPTLASGAYHSCAVVAPDHRVRCWGQNYYGQLGANGDQTHANNRNEPQEVPGVVGVRSLAAGANHTCALLTDGTVECWGNGFRGQLGAGTTPGVQTPTAVPVTDVVALHAGGDHTCATHADGTTSCWGARFDGRFHDDGSAGDRSSPHPLVGVGTPTSIALRNDSQGDLGCVTDAGRVRCWGSGVQGQFGDGPMPTGHYALQTVPTTVVGFAAVTPPVVPVAPEWPVAGPAPGPGAGTGPVVTPVPQPTPPRRPSAPVAELRDGRLALRALTVRRAAKVKTCPRTARAAISGRVAVRSGGRTVNRTVRMTRSIRLTRTATACRTTATIRITGRLAKARKVTLTITGKGIRTTRRTLTARTSVALRPTAVRLDGLVVRSTRKDVCPARATVTVTGATKSTRKRKVVKRNVVVRLAPTANCRLTTTVKLPKALRRVSAATVTVQASGLRTTKRTVRVG
ncbi:MAG: RCC1 domain-containing protein [Solirubrobacteraceae bacterium]